MMKVIITGAAGQVGWELQRTVPDEIELIALQRTDLDITDAQQVSQLFQREKPDWIINAAAYTAVDKAELESELAYRINRDGAANLAVACQLVSAKMLQISTDFVFDGKQNTPYNVNAATNPLGIYGKSKQAGDDEVIRLLADDSAVVRTSWVYSAHGHNFVKTMIDLMNQRDELTIVADQVGTPTWTHGLATALWRLVSLNASGIHHWSDAGLASWYDFAIAIYEEASALGLIKNDCTIKPIRTEQYPLPATRPQFSVLDKSTTIQALAIEPEYWRVSLRRMLKELVSTL